jgi:DNA segregation ATPase FtsK/SpoIIIE, S-DNA-T family
MTTSRERNLQPGAVVGPVWQASRQPARVVRRSTALAARTVGALWRSDSVVRARSVAAYRLRQAPRDLGRLSWFTIRGHARWIGKAWTLLTYGDLRADARAARIAGDPQARRAAQELIRADARARWAKVGLFLHRVMRTALVGAALLIVLWMIDSSMTRDQMWPWLGEFYSAIDNGWSLLTTVVPVVLALTPVGWLMAAIYEGRDKIPGAGWLIRPDRDDADSWIDERMISQALAHLGIAPLDRFFKNGGELIYTIPARLDGNGTFAQIRLPMGVTADMVADRRDRLAANLGRAKLETWPTEGTEAGQLDLWVADKGKLRTGAGPWPLLHDGEVDIFDGVPFGRSQRGQILNAPITERNYLIGGMPGQGKSSAGRTLCLGCVLDPTVEIKIYVFASNPDFDPFTPRLSTYVKGDDDDAVRTGLIELRTLREEVTRRGKLLERYGAAKVTRKLASTVAGLHPIVVVFDEAHELFEHPRYGAEAADLSVKVVKKAHKTGITLIFLTQSPTATSIPKDLTRNCSNGIAYAVADHVANDGLLGSGAYRQGIRATELRPGEDRGTAVTTGLSTNRFELINTFYVPFDEDRDEIAPVIARAMALLAEHGRTVTTTDTLSNADQEPVVDHFSDIRTVLRGEKRVRTQVVLARLAELNPTEYEDWTFHDLATALAEYGIEPAKSQGAKVIRADDINQALTDRHETSDGEGGI